MFTFYSINYTQQTDPDVTHNYAWRAQTYSRQIRKIQFCYTKTALQSTNIIPS